MAPAVPSPALNERQRKHLRRLAHALRPVVRIGQLGVTDGVVRELDRALDDHELVKISARLGDRAQRQLALDQLAQRLKAHLVHRVGHVAVLYRAPAGIAKVVLPG
jgi:RNA-binding protein